MSSKSRSGATAPKKSSESKLLALLAPMFRATPPIRATAAEAGDGDHGELGWTVGLCRGDDLPPLRLSILPQPGARMALRFDACVREPNERC
jgi:hypothetical protein